ncbi:ankyrin repeat-containing protein ITN1-like [Eucalyptus grandis]|uniref:ankyrin repeat-containing protein ITN1-like n=1 Tax=Eucalyptus grandis TaxID=71139 RepID=UPI00192ECB28|nr:ankyrin repeat-containing protein ITN1-like [Eucalyptus grandis]
MGPSRSKLRSIEAGTRSLTLGHKSIEIEYGFIEASLRTLVSSTNELSLVPGPSEQDSGDMMSAAANYYRSFDGVTTEAGEAFQMQRELQWYTAVESWVVPDMRDRYMGSKTFWTSFVENRKDLLESGEKWMKDTSNSCMITSALIATVLFAAAYTVPGGNNDKSGVPLLLGKDSFLVFIISDVLGLFFSVTAILLFLAILTSRCKAQDFLEALPKKIIMGLSFLFLSLAFMLVAFAATLTIVLDKRLVEWVLIPIILLTSVPVALFVVLQLPLLYQMVKSTYGPSIFRPNSIWE